MKAPVDELVANASSNSRMLFLTSLFTLLAAAGAVALVVRGTVIKAVGGVRASLVALAGRDLAQRIKVHSKDEVGQMAEAGCEVEVIKKSFSEIARLTGEPELLAASATD